MNAKVRIVILSSKTDYTTRINSKISQTSIPIEVITITKEAELFSILFNENVFHLICIYKTQQIPECTLISYNVYDDPKYKLRVFVFQETQTYLVNTLNTKTSIYLKTQYPFLAALTNASFFNPDYL